MRVQASVMEGVGRDVENPHDPRVRSKLDDAATQAEAMVSALVDHALSVLLRSGCETGIGTSRELKPRAIGL
jgi:hypothetical protein